jgi:energy-coupling factor transport system ATP-binding protein
MADIASMADKVIVMNTGRIVLEGTPAQVFAHSEELAGMGLNVPPAREITDKLARIVPGFTSEALSITQAAADIKAFINN